MSDESTIDYQYDDASATHTHAYLWGPVCQLIEARPEKRVFELGCGNGAFARHLKHRGYQVEGVDPSEQGIEQARKADPSLPLEVGNAYEPLSMRYGTFPLLVSLEVVEHVYYPKKYARCVADLLEPGGMAVISTPYHSYFKNLVMALSGAMDDHFTVLWDHGHIKFWSVKTLTQLFEEQGLRRVALKRVGRIPILGKSMVLTFQKP